MRAFRSLLISETRIFARDVVALFFTFLFPLIFILIFGFILGDVDRPIARLGLFEVSLEEDAALRDVLSSSGLDLVSRYASADELASGILDREVDFGLTWDGASLAFSYDPSRVQENYAFQQIARGITDALNLRAQGLSSVIRVEKEHVGTEASTRWFNKMVPGIIAFSILSSGLFAISGHLTGMKQRRTLDRLLVTPMPPVALLAAIAAVRLVIVYISTLITLLLSSVVFDLSYSIDWVAYTLLVACATIGMMGLGTVIALVVRRPSSAGNVANVIAMVMMFLSGIYFPIEFMPRFLRAVSLALPLRHLADGMRYATGVSDMSQLRFWLIVGAFLAAGIILFPVLARYAVRPQRT